MTREELNGWNICKERPDAIVFKDVIFDHFEAELKDKDKTILSLIDSQEQWRADLANRLNQVISDKDQEIAERKELQLLIPKTLSEACEEIFNLKELIDELKEAQTSWIAERADLQTKLKEKDQEIAKYDNISAELFRSRTKCFEHIEQLEAVIEKQGERIRYLEQQFRDLNPKEINQ